MTIAAALIDGFAGRARQSTLAPGEVLVRKGDVADAVFVVVTGGFDAIDDSDGGEVVVGRLGAGQIAGEITVVAGGKRTATLRATETTEVMTIERSEFEAWLAEHAEIADEVSAQARERIDRGAGRGDGGRIDRRRRNATGPGGRRPRVVAPARRR